GRGRGGDDRRTAVRAGASGSRSAHPHRRRAAGVQLPPLGGRLRRDVGDRRALAGLRRRPPGRRARLVRPPRAAVRALTDLFRRTLTAIVYAAIVLGATFAPPVILGLVALLAGTVGLFEASILRRAGAVAIGEAIVVVLGLAALVYLRILGDRGAAPAAAAGLPVWLVPAVGAPWAAGVGADGGGR